MPYDAITTAEIAVDKPITNELLQKFVNRDDFLNAEIGTLSADGLQNANFEVDSDLDGQPDGWTVTFFTNGTGALDTSTSISGKQSYKFTHPGGAGNGGGEIESEYIPVSTLRTYTFGYAYRASVTNMGIVSGVRFYDKDQVFTTGTSIFNTTVSSTSWSEKRRQVALPAGSKYAKIYIDGGSSALSNAGDVYIDSGYFLKSIITDDITTASVTQSRLKTSTNSLGGTFTSTVGTFAVPLGDYSFAPGIASERLGAIQQIIVTAGSGVTPVYGTIGLTLAGTTVTTGATYNVIWRSITASKGFKGAVFTNSSGNEAGVYTFSDAPHNYRDIWDYMAESNGWTWEPTTRKNT